jgi:hypothetical protein
MSRTTLMIAMYCLSGGLVSAILAAKAHLGILLVALLPVIVYLVYLCWKLSQRRSEISRCERCLACQKSIGPVRRLSHHRFCCDEHQNEWLDELDEIAIDRLQAGRNETPALKLREPAFHQAAFHQEDDVQGGDFALALANR